ncbi:MAG: 5'-methylthioadenosine/S-adenosylhomocysteine nucleosidase [Eubacteriales bacterium]|nr:5'-methylthioadenosine/S-adenosylhomocysteine nucleosidase [Eubacteriales bacterium]
MKNKTVSEKTLLRFYSGTIENTPVVTLFCGVCKTNAAIATQILIDTFDCDSIINAGTAGGMDKQLNIFDTVISTQVAHWDITDGILTEFHPWAKSMFFKSDIKLIEIAKKAASGIENVYFGRMVSGEAFIEDKYRNEINKKFSPLCTDMETASIAQACYVNNIPFISIRTITDNAEHSGEKAFLQNCERASQISADIVKNMLKEISMEINYSEK